MQLNKTKFTDHWFIEICNGALLYPRPTKLEGGYTGFTLSVCPSVCRRHGFRSISQVCFGTSISNFICMLILAIGRSLFIFSNVTYKMAAWRPYWIFLFPDSNLTLALNINFKLQRHNTYVYGSEPIDFQQRHFHNGCLAAILDFSVSGLCRWQGFRDVSKVCFGFSNSNFTCMLMVVIGKSLLIFSEVTFWWPYWIFWFPDSNFSLALNINSKLKWHNTYVYV